MKKSIKFVLFALFSFNLAISAVSLNDIKSKIKNYSFFINGSKVKKLKSMISSYSPQEAPVLLDILQKIQPNDEEKITTKEILDYIDANEQYILNVSSELEASSGKKLSTSKSFLEQSPISSAANWFWDFVHPTTLFNTIVFAIFLGLVIVLLGFLISFLI